MHVRVRMYVLPCFNIINIQWPDVHNLCEPEYKVTVVLVLLPLLTLSFLHVSAYTKRLHVSMMHKAGCEENKI